MSRYGLSTIEGARREFARRIRAFNKIEKPTGSDIAIYRANVYGFVSYLGYLVKSDIELRVDKLEKDAGLNQ